MLREDQRQERLTKITNYRWRLSIGEMRNVIKCDQIRQEDMLCALSAGVGIALTLYLPVNVCNFAGTRHSIKRLLEPGPMLLHYPLFTFPVPGC